MQINKTIQKKCNVCGEKFTINEYMTKQEMYSYTKILLLKYKEREDKERKIISPNSDKDIQSEIERFQLNSSSVQASLLLGKTEENTCEKCKKMQMRNNNICRMIR